MPFTNECAGDHVTCDAGGHAQQVLQIEHGDETHAGEDARDKLIDQHRSVK